MSVAFYNQLLYVVATAHYVFYRHQLCSSKNVRDRVNMCFFHFTFCGV